MLDVIHIPAVTQQDFLASLGNDAEGRLDHTVNPLSGNGGAGQEHTFQGFDNSIGWNGSRDQLNQLLPIGLYSSREFYPRRLFFPRRLLIVYRIHHSLFSSFPSILQ
jgi:hypothetical protein